MEIGLFSLWLREPVFGFMALSVDRDREDDLVYALIGFSWDKEDKILQVDFFWKCFEFNFSNQKV